MSEEKEINHNPRNLSLKIPTITSESETQTAGRLISKTPERTDENTMEDLPQYNSIRKRRNLSKNRTQATRNREKTPEPGRMGFPHEDTTSDDEEPNPNRSSREIEADNTYEEMKRMVQKNANVRDPIYDMNTEEIREIRAKEALDRRRRSVSPFAVQELEEIKAASGLQRKGSFINPANKLLGTTYTLSPKDEDNSRRNSLTIETTRERKNSLTPPASSSPKDFPFSLPTTPKKLEEMVYPDEARTPSKLPKSPGKIAEVFTFETKEDKPGKTVSPKAADTPTSPGELVTKVIQVERTPSRKLAPENKPVVEVRERIVRTPSRKSIVSQQPLLKQQQIKPKEESQSKNAPVKPARSKISATGFLGAKTSESEMSEDQGIQQNVGQSRRKVVPTPRRFIKNRSPRANRSQSVNRVEDVQVVDRTGSSMTQTSREIIELMQKARARSLSIPKDDPRIIPDYKKYSKTLQTPNKTPSTPRKTRGISCPKTIKIISNTEVLAGITLASDKKKDLKHEKQRKQNSDYIDASQSEYTSSYSSSASENEYEFDLSEKAAELTRKLNLLSEEAKIKEDKHSILAKDIPENEAEKPRAKPILRKRSTADVKSEARKHSLTTSKEQENEKIILDSDKNKKPTRSRWKFIANWQQFKQEYKTDYLIIKYMINRCICDFFLLIFMCGLGGIMFKALEGSFENAYKCGTRNVKRDFLESLWRGSHYLREEDWKSMARKKLFEFENQLHTAHEAGVTSYSGQRSWNFMNSFVYCLTLISTVGYGHIAPKTFYGRVATIVYAVIGIPLFLIVLADFGKLFTRIIKFFWAYIRRFYYTRSCRKVRNTVHVDDVMKGLNIVYDVVRRPSQMFNEGDIENAEDGQPPVVERKPSDVPPPLPPKPGTIVTEPETPAPSVFEIDDEFNLPISVAIFILVVYIIIGAVGYNMWETWSFFESFYFVFISMSTIGLGDLVPDHPMFMMASILYLVFGLALTSMCINVVQVKLSNTFKQASAKLGATIGLKVSEEDGSLVPTTPIPGEIVPVHKSKKEEGTKDEENAKDR